MISLLCTSQTCSPEGSGIEPLHSTMNTFKFICSSIPVTNTLKGVLFKDITDRKKKKFMDIFQETQFLVAKTDYYNRVKCHYFIFKVKP